MELLTNYSNTSHSHSAWKETIHGCASLGFRHAKSSSNMKCTSKSWWPRQNHGHCFFQVLGPLSQWFWLIGSFSFCSLNTLTVHPSCSHACTLQKKVSYNACKTCMQVDSVGIITYLHLPVTWFSKHLDDKSRTMMFIHSNLTIWQMIGQN